MTEIQSYKHHKYALWLSECPLVESEHYINFSNTPPTSTLSSWDFHNLSTKFACAAPARKSWFARGPGLAAAGHSLCAALLQGTTGRSLPPPCCLGSSPRSAVSQGDYCALSPSSVEEIEQMNSLFQQKQRELVLAVSKVEELTRQLEMLKNGRIDGYHDNQSAVAELDRLYKELQVMQGLWLTHSLKGGKLVGSLLALLGKDPDALALGRAAQLPRCCRWRTGGTVLEAGRGWGFPSAPLS